MGWSRLFRSRWAATFWAAGICWMAVSTVGGGEDLVDAATAPSSNAAALSALAAEDD